MDVMADHANLDPDLTDDDILANVQDRLHGPMSGFVERYFGRFQYVRRGDSVLEIKTAGRACGQCTIPSAVPWPTDHDAGHFLAWLSGYLARETDGARDGSWLVSGVGGNTDHGHGQGSQILLTRLPGYTEAAVSDKKTWRNTHVVGFFASHGQVQPGSCSASASAYRAGLVHLCRAAHRVFASQPARLFLHGFYLRGWLLELWVFDRSGLYCSDVVDVRADVAVRLLAVLLSYARMTDEELGTGNVVTRVEMDDGRVGDGQRCVRTSLGELVLDEENLLACREELVGPGMACYRARKKAGDDAGDEGGDDAAAWRYVVKFKWRWARERPEDEFLRLARDKCASDEDQVLSLSLDWYEEFESTASLRRGFRWGRHRRLRVADDDAEADSDPDPDTADGLARYTTDTNQFFQNRILVCVVTSPLGRPLHSFRSPDDLLAVLRDAVRCHRSLYRDARILHQDVSPGNIVIVDGLGEDPSRGLLIDLDSAIRLPARPDADAEAGEEAEAEAEAEYSITGTRPFMAIGVLLGHRHTPRHDLESFLYVLVWTIICGRGSGSSPPPGSRLREWSSSAADWGELAARKTRDVGTAAAFEETILAEFPAELACLRRVAERLRGVLFPCSGRGGRDEEEDAEAPYDDVICVLDEERVALRSVA
ncbi:hypothetical protein E4U21_006804 [Claviceps maximensis]|nr:hypothetical protein E4U21_006804 [Claviceps maximensis]